MALLCLGCARPPPEAAPLPTPSHQDLSGAWRTTNPFTNYRVVIEQSGTAISGHGEMSSCVIQGVPFTLTGIRSGDEVTMVLASDKPGLSQSNTYRLVSTTGPRGDFLFLDLVSSDLIAEPCNRLYPEVLLQEIRAGSRAASRPAPVADRP